MNPQLTWTSIEDLAIALADKHPDVDPLTVRFTDLHRWVTELTQDLVERHTMFEALDDMAAQLGPDLLPARHSPTRRRCC